MVCNGAREFPGRFFYGSQKYRYIITEHREFLLSSEPLGLVFDPEAQTRRELVAERLNVEDCDFCGFISHLVLLKTFYGTYHDTSCRYS